MMNLLSIENTQIKYDINQQNFHNCIYYHEGWQQG